MFRRSSPLPNVPIYTLLWNIGENFGGLTVSSIQRTNAFARVGRKNVELLTLDPAMDPKLKSKELKSQGWLHKRVKMRNIWHDLRRSPERVLRRLDGKIDKKVIVHKDDLLDFQGQLFTEKTTANGAILQTDFFREDGSVFASDMRDTGLRGKRDGRLVTLFTSRGVQLGQWTSLTDFYYSWLDHLSEGREMVLITDSPGVGARMRNYERSNVLKAQIQHNCHLEDARGPVEGVLAARWDRILINSDKYDLLVFLTERQRKDVIQTQLDPGNLAVIPNMYRGESVERPSERPRTRGIQVGRLGQLKQVDHAIQAIARTQSATLDIFGGDTQNQSQANLETLAHELVVADRVKLHGYSPKANEYFRDASFSLLSSRTEGQGLVLLESMAAGCIPIAYDIRYGPSDIIKSGVDGFLVPPDDINTLAETIETVVSMPEGELRSMRQAAIDRAREFMEPAIVDQWGVAIKQALETISPPLKDVGRAEVSFVRTDDKQIEIELSITGIDHCVDWAAVAWKGRLRSLYGRVPAQLTVGEDDIVVTVSIPVSRLVATGDETFDIFVDTRSGTRTQRLRLTYSDAIQVLENRAVAPLRTKKSNFSLRVLATSGESI